MERNSGSKNGLPWLFLPTSGLDRKSAAPLTTQRGKRDSRRDCGGVVRFAALLSGITTRRSQRRGTLHCNKRFYACVARAPSRPPPPPSLRSFRRHVDQLSWTGGFIFDKSLSLSLLWMNKLCESFYASMKKLLKPLCIFGYRYVSRCSCSVSPSRIEARPPHVGTIVKNAALFFTVGGVKYSLPFPSPLF